MSSDFKNIFFLTWPFRPCYTGRFDPKLEHIGAYWSILEQTRMLLISEPDANNYHSTSNANDSYFGAE